jgi:hypothetical protein
MCSGLNDGLTTSLLYHKNKTNKQTNKQNLVKFFMGLGLKHSVNIVTNFLMNNWATFSLPINTVQHEAKLAPCQTSRMVA